MVPDESQSGGIAPGYDVQAAAAAVAVEGALDASCAVAPGVPAADASGGSMQARIEAFCTSYGLNSEAQGVIERLVPEAQETVMTQFSPKGVQPGSYEMNGKLIMFARNVERGYKGGGKGKGKDAGKGYAAPPAAACGVSPPPPPCMGGGYAPSPMGGGCMPSNGCPPAPCGCQGGCGGWDGWSQGGCGYGGCDYSWGGCKGGYDWGKGGCGGGGGYGAWGKGDYGKGGGGCDYSQSWGMPPAPPPAMGGGYGMGGGMDYGCGGGGCCGASAGGMMGGAGYGGAEPAPVAPEALDEFIGKWGLNEDAKAVLLSLAPAVQQTVMEQFRGGDVGGVNGRFIVFARGVEKGRKGTSKGGPRPGPY